MLLQAVMTDVTTSKTKPAISTDRVRRMAPIHLPGIMPISVPKRIRQAINKAHPTCVGGFSHCCFACSENSLGPRASPGA